MTVRGTPVDLELLVVEVASSGAVGYVEGAAEGVDEAEGLEARVPPNSGVGEAGGNRRLAVVAGARSTTPT